MAHIRCEDALTMRIGKGDLRRGQVILEPADCPPAHAAGGGVSKIAIVPWHLWLVPRIGKSRHPADGIRVETGHHRDHGMQVGQCVRREGIRQIGRQGTRSDRISDRGRELHRSGSKATPGRWRFWRGSARPRASCGTFPWYGVSHHRRNRSVACIGARLHRRKKISAGTGRAPNRGPMGGNCHRPLYFNHAAPLVACARRARSPTRVHACSRISGIPRTWRGMRGR